MTQHQKNVREMMQAFGQTVRDKPEMPTLEERKRIAALIMEEAIETVRDGLGLAVCAIGKGESVWLCEEETSMDFFGGEYTPNLTELADGLGDLSVVGLGGACAAGIDLEPIELEIDRSNLTKAKGGHKDPTTGKWIKPASYSPANIQPILETQANAKL